MKPTFLRLAPLVACLLLVSGASAELTEPSARCVPPARINVVGPDGSAGARVTRHNFAADRAPTWSPDSTRIAFQRAGDILITSATGGRPTRLTETRIPERHPSWSPYGTLIAYERGYHTHQIVVARVDGSGSRSLTIGLSDDVEPDWSPDGKRIAFASNRLGSYDVFTMNADGTRLADLTRGSIVDERSPSWSPDGRKIAFGAGADLFVMNTDGSGRSNLTNDGARDKRPAWSPNGALIAFAREVGGRPSLYVMRSNGTSPRLVAGIGDSPSWAPDGRLIAYSLDGAAPVSGAPTCVVPRVLGLRLTDAQDAILRRGCASGRTRYASSLHHQGRVIRQYPRGGVQRAARACVYLVVSTGRD